ncbi:MAG: hypothetical protein K0S76_45 [Herbinix sp.]|nr:hypothetical protein [Herbinix sp.]
MRHTTTGYTLFINGELRINNGIYRILMKSFARNLKKKDIMTDIKYVIINE